MKIINSVSLSLCFVVTLAVLMTLASVVTRQWDGNHFINQSPLLMYIFDFLCSVITFGHY